MQRHARHARNVSESRPLCIDDAQGQDSEKYPLCSNPSLRALRILKIPANMQVQASLRTDGRWRWKSEKTVRWTRRVTTWTGQIERSC